MGIGRRRIVRAAGVFERARQGLTEKNRLENYWFPKERTSPQSGQTQVMLLHVMPQRHSSMQVWQISNPQAQLQQNRKVFWQQAQ